MNAERAHVLVVDDDVELCELLTVRMEARGYRVSSEYGVRAALTRIGREPIDVILLDLRIGDEDGLDVLDAIYKRSLDVPVVILTAHGTIDTAVEAMKRGAFGFVTKPFHDLDLLQKVAQAVESHRLRREVADLRRIVGAEGDDARLLGVSPAIEHVREFVGKVGPTEATVLISGESGTGKELVARSIHAVSSRSAGPFVAVNCAALAPDVLESTLFGHASGSSVEALADREGLFGAARKGTLFLDEVGETPLSVQAKLLRVLEERRYTRVGSNVEQDADVRIVAATNRDLRQEVSERRFREDLFYRLHVVPIAMPPLRERRDDVAVLAEVFLERSAARHGVPVPHLGGEVLAVLARHSFPGNVRELANLMEAAVLLCRGSEVTLEHLAGVPVDEPVAMPTEFDRAIAAVLTPYASASAAHLPPLRDARDLFERTYLDAMLARTSGNVANAAKLAGRNRTDFYDLLRRHGLSPSAQRKAD